MNPYLSIVVASRNDNHGGDLNERTTAFMKNVYYQAKKWKVATELIVVEWNPPADRPLLSEILPRPESDTPVTLRYIIVPPEIHNRYIHSAYIPLYQMIAKNAGIRRARGEFVLCTNVDILFSNECFKIFSKKNLEKGKYYRANRCDVPKEAARINDPEEQLAFCRKNITKRLGKLRGAEGIDELSYLFFFRYLAVAVNYFYMKLWHITHPDKFPHFILDTTACGDFTLMSKQDWLDIEGYVELDMYSIHVDSMALWAAQALGKKQEVLEGASCVYHIAHDNGWESENALKTIQFISQKPCIDYGLVLKGGFQIIQLRKTWGLNDANWGFANIELEEICFNNTVIQTHSWKKLR